MMNIKNNIEDFIKRVKTEYKHINLIYEYYDEDDIYSIKHDSEDLQFNNNDFMSFCGNLIDELFLKFGFYNISFGYDYNYDCRLQSEQYENIINEIYETIINKTYEPIIEISEDNTIFTNESYTIENKNACWDYNLQDYNSCIKPCINFENYKIDINNTLNSEEICSINEYNSAA